MKVVKHKERDDFKMVFEEYYNPLCNYALRLIGNGEAAEDIVQTLFIQLWEEDKLATVTKLERFLLRSTKFKCIDYLRKQSTFKKVSWDGEGNFESEEHSELEEADVEPLLNYFAAKLPRKTREVFLLSRRSGLTYREIADETNISAKTVEVHMSKALKMMRKLLKEQGYFALQIGVIIKFLLGIII
ncbi:MAG: RNA polymerase sigma-70 factor [Marinilabiliaceae bacterium]|nr:RNA polymerase sigma-70 factor [Marinilabiliaceae bacterium]